MCVRCTLRDVYTNTQMKKSPTLSERENSHYATYSSPYTSGNIQIHSLMYCKLTTVTGSVCNLTDAD